MLPAIHYFELASAVPVACQAMSMFDEHPRKRGGSVRVGITNGSAPRPVPRAARRAVPLGLHRAVRKARFPPTCTSEAAVPFRLRFPLACDSLHNPDEKRSIDE